jgi:hypothetical protein
VALLDGYGETNSLWEMFAPLVVRGKITLTVNIVLHEVVTECSALGRTQYTLKQILTSVAASELKLCVKCWTILHSTWTVVIR